MKRYILLDNIRSLHNVGSIFRTADGSWFDMIYLTGYTPTPPRKEISKTALDAENSVPWEFYKDPTEIIQFLQWQWVKILCIEQDGNSKSIENIKIHKNDSICYIVWNEKTWVSKSLLNIADVIIELPMLGIKQSLNVSVTAGIIMYIDMLYKRI